MINKPIRSKQQFKSLLTKQLGFLSGPIVYPRSKFQEFHKEISISKGRKGWIHLIFENVGDPYLGEQTLLPQMNVMLDTPGYHWESNNAGFCWVGNLSEEVLHKPITRVINSDFSVPIDSEYDSNNISTTEKFNELKKLIDALEQTDYFKKQLEQLWEKYGFGFIVKEEVISKLPKILPEFKNMIDEYEERGCITFYTNEIKGKATVPIIEIAYGNKDWITLLVGKGKLENGKLVSNPKDGYFYRNYPYYIYSNDVHIDVDSWGKEVSQKIMGWKYKDLDAALEELKKYVNGNDKDFTPRDRSRLYLP